MRIPNVHLLQDLQLQGGLAALALAGLPEFQQLVKSPQEKSSLTVLAEWRKVGPIYKPASFFASKIYTWGNTGSKVNILLMKRTMLVILSRSILQVK